MSGSPEADEDSRMLQEMESASRRFYASAVQIGHHQFVEFTGLMNEYILMCRGALAKGQSILGRQEADERNWRYIREKLDCIFGWDRLVESEPRDGD